MIICENCVYYYKKERLWIDKCLMSLRIYNFIEHIKNNILPFNRCEYKKNK